jgi:PrtD family type I secretion system ABC transporter
MAKSTDFVQEIKASLRPVAWAVIGVSFFINLLILPMSLYALQVMDRVVNTGSIATLIWLTLIMVAMFAVAGLLQSLRSMTLVRAAEWMHGRIADALLPVVLTQAAAGNKGAQHLRDASTLRAFISGAALTTLLDAPWSVLYIAALCIVHVSLGLLVIAGAALLLGLAWLNESATRDPLKEAGLRQMRSMQELELATRNAEATQAMGMGAALTARWQQMQERVSELQWLGTSRAAIIQGVTKWVRLCLQVFITGLSAWLAIRGDVTTGAIIAAAILASRALAPFESAIGSWNQLIETRSAYDRLTQAIEQEALAEDNMQLPAPEGVLSAEAAAYAAPGSAQPIIRNIQFQLEAGEAMGIIGASGCGKSTLARLLTGVMTPTAGAIRLDGADIYRWPRESFGRYVGYLPQDVELFGGTVHENISRFRSDADPEATVKAAQLAGAHELILRLPGGYDTQIGAGGALLSAGQRQRIGLARAFYGDPRLLVLDEPDANLDDSGQQALVMALRRAKHDGITCVVVTHRKPLLAHVDKLLFMHEGTVGAFGATANVLESLAQHAQRLQAKQAAEQKAEAASA